MELSKPLKEPLDKLLTYKQQSGLQSALAKRMSVGFYGKFGEERKEEFGPYFNPVYFTEISTQVRLQVAEFLYWNDIGPEHNDDLLHVSIDGCLLTREVSEMQTRDSSQWRLSGVMPALIISSGLVFYANKKPKGLGLEDVLGLIRKHPKSSYYVKKLKRRVTLAEALAQDRFEDLGKEVEMVSSIDLVRLEHDRIFDKLPESGEQLLSKKYRSRPKKVKTT